MSNDPAPASPEAGGLLPVLPALQTGESPGYEDRTVLGGADNAKIHD